MPAFGSQVKWLTNEKRDFPSPECHQERTVEFVQVFVNSTRFE